MALRAVLEVIVDAFLLAQTLDEVQVVFVVLGAVNALRAATEAIAAISRLQPARLSASPPRRSKRLP